MEGLESELIEVVQKGGYPEQLPRILASGVVLNAIIPDRTFTGEPEHIEEEQTTERQDCESDPLLGNELEISETTATSVQLSQ